MPTPKQTSPETVSHMAEQLVGIELGADDQKRVADLLNALADEMKAMRDMDVGTDEPAPVFEATKSE